MSEEPEWPHPLTIIAQQVNEIILLKARLKAAEDLFLPIVLVYTAIVFRALRGVVTTSMVETNSHSLY